MKLKKKTRKKLKRLARSAGALGAAFMTELLSELTATFARRSDGHDDREREDEHARLARRSDRSRSNGTAEHDPLPRTADSH